MAESSDNTNYFKGYYNQSPGIADVGSYQVSGYPWITGSIILDGQEHELNFPSVTNSVSIQNKTLGGGAGANTDILVHFETSVASGVKGNHQYIKLAGATGFPGQDASSQLTLDTLKCKKIYISHGNQGGNPATYELQAALTGISAANMFVLTGSGISTR
jgi:hypothetical protein